MSGVVSLPVRAGLSRYQIHVGAGCLSDIEALVPLPYMRIALVHDEALPESLVERAASSLGASADLLRIGVAAGEDAKVLGHVERVARALAAGGLHRGDLVAALGGGATTDLGGFAAATYHRGVDWLALPTTLLGMVDAAIGGKTAVNLAEGKNLVGAFHQPIAVVADVDALATLPDGELRSGLAEIVKHGLIGDPGLLAEIRAAAPALSERDPAATTRIVARAAAVKVAVVEADATERDVRAHLNYGHTLGHALETLGHSGDGPPRRHGEAVAIGMMFAAFLARRLGRPDLVAEHRDALDAVGLPTGGAAVGFEQALRIMSRDKKAERGLRFVLLDAIGRPRVVTGVGEEDLRAAFGDVA